MLLGAAAPSAAQAHFVRMASMERLAVSVVSDFLAAYSADSSEYSCSRRSEHSAVCGFTLFYEDGSAMCDGSLNIREVRMRGGGRSLRSALARYADC